MLIYHPNHITKQQEKEILNILPPFVKINTTHRNRIVRYGLNRPYDSYVVSDKIPDVFKNLGIEDFDSVTVNEYDKHQSIPYHIDDKNAGDKITVLSLLGSAEVTFRNVKDKTIKQSFIIEPLSLYIMQDELRWDYEHSAIANDLRYSVVFRKHKPFSSRAA